MARRLSPDLGLLRALVPPRGYIPDFLTPYGCSADPVEAVAPVLDTSVSRLRREVGLLAVGHGVKDSLRPLAEGRSCAVRRLGEALVRYHRVAVGPFWPTVRDEVAAGHEIGNHTWSHRDLTTLKPAEITDQIGRADQAIEAATGFRPTLVRPPYGAFNRTVQKTVDRPLVLWRVDPRDWEHHDSAYVADYITKHVRPGDVVLMHDIHATTVDAVPQILDTLAERGYHFVTVSQLLAPTQLTTDKTWSHNENAAAR
jgi:hypothetical protein